jgi:hypothetical protein
MSIDIEPEKNLKDELIASKSEVGKTAANTDGLGDSKRMTVMAPLENLPIDNGYLRNT